MNTLGIDPLRRRRLGDSDRHPLAWPPFGVYPYRSEGGGMGRMADAFRRPFGYAFCFLLLVSCAGGGGDGTGAADETPAGSPTESVAGPTPRVLSASGPLKAGTYTFEGF